MRSSLKVSWVALLSFLLMVSLAACGGGGGGSGNNGSRGDNNGSSGINIKYHDVQIANIVIDGKRDDWDGIAPAVTDAEGDDLSSYTGADAKELYIAQSNDLSKVYVMMVFWDGPPNPDLASSYTSDGDAEHPNVQQGYGVYFDTCVFNSYLWPCVGVGATYDTVNNQWKIEIISVLSGSFDRIYSGTVHGDDVLEWEFPISILKSTIEAEDFKGEVNTSAFSDRRDDISELFTSNQLLVVRFNK